MKSPQFILPLRRGMKVVLFAGGGGSSEADEKGPGEHVNIAINHDPEALAMHRANHPQAWHFCSDVYSVDPIEVCEGDPVDTLHASPDCTEHSQAKGGHRARRSCAASHGWASSGQARSGRSHHAGERARYVF